MSDDNPLERFVRELQREIDQEERRTYSPIVIEEAFRPHNMRRMEHPHGRAVHIGPCGDTMEIFLRVEGEVIIDSTFLTDGCGPTVAVGSRLMKMIRGKRVSDALQMTDEDLTTEVGGLPPENLHCSGLAMTTLYKAIDDLYDKGVLQ